MTAFLPALSARHKMVQAKRCGRLSRVGFTWVLASVCALLASVVVSSVPVAAQSKADLTLTLVPNLYVVDAQAGKETRLVLEVRNTGDTALAGISLTSDKADGLRVNLDPSQIASISPGEVRTVDVDIIPASTVTRGEYSVTLIASVGGLQRTQFVQVKVEPASYWVWVASGIAVVVIAVFILVFLRLGKKG